MSSKAPSSPRAVPVTVPRRDGGGWIGRRGSLRLPMLPERAEPPEPPSPRVVLEVAQALARELQPQRKSWSSLTLDSSLERDLGLDSLGRVELLARLERSFAVRLPEAALGSAE